MILANREKEKEKSTRKKEKRIYSEFSALVFVVAVFALRKARAFKKSQRPHGLSCDLFVQDCFSQKGFDFCYLNDQYLYLATPMRFGHIQRSRSQIVSMQEPDLTLNLSMLGPSVVLSRLKTFSESQLFPKHVKSWRSILCA